jgi:hypothetical protein
MWGVVILDGEIADNPNGLKALGLSLLQPVSMPESIMVFGHMYIYLDREMKESGQKKCEI